MYCTHHIVIHLFEYRYQKVISTHLWTEEVKQHVIEHSSSSEKKLFDLVHK